MRWRHIIWDWNGTLIDDVRLCVDIINTLLVKYKKPELTLEDYRRVFDFPVKEYYRRIGFNYDETPFEIVGSEFMEAYWRRWKECDLHAGARALMTELKSRRVPQAVVSAAETRMLQACVQHFNIADYFDALCGLDHHYATSKEELAVEFVNSLNIDAQHILFIGDTRHDYDVATAAGVECVLFSGGHHPRYKLESCGVPVFDSLEEVRDFLFED